MLVLVLVLMLMLMLEEWAEDIGNATCRQIVIDAPLQGGGVERISGRPPHVRAELTVAASGPGAA
ncbi:hypothetical protein XarjCFBP7653_05030 [Xanthomonas arboricola]|nr:hypothetical protein XarjCFBP7653_05030 [Xanthomonas arboricola]